MSDFFVRDEDEKKDAKVTKKLEPKKPKTEPKDEFISRQYIKIKLDSLGLLDAPEVLHVRNYTMDDALEMSLASQENALETMIAVIGRMIKEEGFNPAYLHEDEMREILLTVYASFWSSEIPLPFPFTDEELEAMSPEDLQKVEDGFYKAQVDIRKIKTTPLREDFKEPIKISIKGQDVYFRLSRIKDALEAKSHVEKMFLKEERKLSDLISKENKTPEEQRTIDDFERRKTRELMRAIQAAVLVRVGSKNLETLQDKLKYYQQVSIPFWKAYGDITDKVKFGINPDVEVIHPITKETVIRRFQFRFLDFISALDLQGDSDYSFSFGD